MSSIKTTPSDDYGQGDAPSEDDARRVIAFQRKCAAVREQTQHEIARLQRKREAVRAQWGISCEHMTQWRDEHQRMLDTPQPEMHQD